MKKLFSILMLFALTVFTVETSTAQGYVKLKQGAAGDTIHKSSTLFTSIVNLNVNAINSLSMQVATDSVSGTPDTKYVLQRSVDGVHWISVAGDTLAPVYIGNGNTTHPSVSKQLDIAAFYGTFARVKIYTGSGTQKSKMWITIKAGVAP